MSVSPPAAPPTRPKLVASERPLDEASRDESASDTAKPRYDPKTGAFLGPTFDPITGERIHSSTTRWFPRRPSRAFWLSQAVWCVLMIVIGFGMAGDGYYPVGVAFGLIVWEIIGATAITTVSFVYRKLRRWP